MVNIEAKWVRNGNTLALLKLIQGNQKKGKKKKVLGSQTRLLELALAISLIILIFFSFQSTTSLFLCRKCQMWNLVQS